MPLLGTKVLLVVWTADRLLSLWARARTKSDPQRVPDTWRFGELAC